jgi:methyl coenzyme M reductase subunit D
MSGTIRAELKTPDGGRLPSAMAHGPASGELQRETRKRPEVRKADIWTHSVQRGRRNVRFSDLR